MRTRALFFMADQDLRAGRDGEVTDAHSDLREALFRVSPAFIHFTDRVFFNSIRWDELHEHGVFSPEEGDDVLIPEGHLALASCTPSRRGAFNRCLVKMKKDGHAYLFVHNWRAVQGLGGRAHPLPQAWAEHNNDRPRDIVAAALTGLGFERAVRLLKAHRVVLPWRKHERAVAEREWGLRWKRNEGQE